MVYVFELYRLVRVVRIGLPVDRYKKREKKRENLEIQHCSPNLDPLPVGFSVLRRENLQRSQGEGPMRGLLIEASQGDFFSLRRLLEEKTFLLPTTKWRTLVLLATSIIAVSSSCFFKFVKVVHHGKKL
ncbi:hypothetical protein BHE74_00054665 [Ensete ventricosum]|nr:hypothetical protein BHE74_00054665 [Ensete ventricosum]